MRFFRGRIETFVANCRRVRRGPCEVSSPPPLAGQLFKSASAPGISLPPLAPTLPPLHTRTTTLSESAKQTVSILDKPSLHSSAGSVPSTLTYTLVLAVVARVYTSLPDQSRTYPSVQLSLSRLRLTHARTSLPPPERNDVR